MVNFIKTFVRDESGASAAEYALIIAIVGVGIGAAALALGANVKAAIGESSNEVYACNNAASAAAARITRPSTANPADEPGTGLSALAAGPVTGS